MRDKAFGQGLSTSLDVVDAQTQLAGVKTQRRRRLSIRDLLARLLALSGQMNCFNQYQHGQAIEVNS